MLDETNPGLTTSTVPNPILPGQNFLRYPRPHQANPCLTKTNSFPPAFPGSEKKKMQNMFGGTILQFTQNF